MTDDTVSDHNLSGSAYDALADVHGGDERWAFGTGFDDPLAGVDRTLPPGVDASAVGAECLDLGDDALVMSQRLAAWCSKAPELEDEVAMANIALDLLGQARLLLARAAQADPSLRPGGLPPSVADEDALAYFRDASGFRNVQLAELDDADDFAMAVGRLFVFVTWRLASMGRVASSADPVLAAIATKARTELIYHREYAAGWVVRLGDGTGYSRDRMQAALDRLWPHAAPLLGDPATSDEVGTVVGQVLTAATLTQPRVEDAPTVDPGRAGVHTDALSSLLEEMQTVARADTAATW